MEGGVISKGNLLQPYLSFQLGFPHSLGRCQIMEEMEEEEEKKQWKEQELEKKEEVRTQGERRLALAACSWSNTPFSCFDYVNRGV